MVVGVRRQGRNCAVTGVSRPVGVQERELIMITSNIKKCPGRTALMSSGGFEPSLSVVSVSAKKIVLWA